jgi:hypothetical protein
MVKAAVFSSEELVASFLNTDVIMIHSGAHTGYICSLQFRTGNALILVTTAAFSSEEAIDSR